MRGGGGKKPGSGGVNNLGMILCGMSMKIFTTTYT